MAERMELKYFRDRRVLVPSYQSFGTVERVYVDGGFTFYVKLDSDTGKRPFKFKADDVCLKCTEFAPCSAVHHAESLARAVRQVLEDVHES